MCDKKGLNSKWCLGVVLFVYLALYGVSVFTQVKNVAFMGVDEGSIIEAINNLFQPYYYNMLGSYHTKFYGWSYVAINFFVLAPFKLFGLSNSVAINIIIRLVLFVIGLASTFVFFFVGRRLFGTVLSFFLTLFFLSHPVAAHYFTTIHPESTGTLFYLIGLLFLGRFVSDERKMLVNYKWAVVAFSISSLSKQPYFFICFATLLCFPYFFIKIKNINLFDFVSSKLFYKLFFMTAGISLLTAFIIHPYAFARPDMFLEFQRKLLQGSSRISFEDVSGLWTTQIISNPIVIINIALLLLPVYIRKYRINLYIYSVAVSSFLTILFVYKARLFVSITYLYPLYPVYILNVGYAFHLIYRNLARRYLNIIKPIMIFLGIILVMPHFIYNISDSAAAVYKKWLLDDLSTKSLSWDYIETLPADTKISYLPTVAVPDSYREIGCHVWQGCATEKALEAFSPDYVFVSWEYPHFNAEEWKNFLTKNSYKKVTDLKPFVNIVQPEGVADGVHGSSWFNIMFSPIRQLKIGMNNIQDIKKDLLYYSRGLVVEGLQVSVYKKLN